MELVLVAVVCVLLGVGGAVIWMRRRGPPPAAGQVPATAAPPLPTAVHQTPAEPVTVMPSQVVVSDGDREIMSLTLLDDADAARKQLTRATPLPTQAVSGLLGRMIEPLMQAAPSAGVAAMANSSTLMEVVINGPMLAASDGNGLRAIAKAGKGFEHARLFEPTTLQTVANVAAIWQLASIVVAQKHLADISAALRRVESKVDGIQSFLEEERLAVIRSAMKYLETAKQAIEAGEFLAGTRDKLETFDIELDRAGMTLLDQIERESAAALERDSVGCEGEYQSALAKHTRLKRLVGELTLSNEVRLANWYVCSVYPDNSKMLASRLEQIKKDIDQAKALKDRLAKALEHDCGLIDAKWTSDKVIEQRRAEVSEVGRLGQIKLQNSLSHHEAIILKIESVRAERNRPSRLIVETKDGMPAAVYMCQ